MELLVQGTLRLPHLGLLAHLHFIKRRNADQTFAGVFWASSHLESLDLIRIVVLDVLYNYASNTRFAGRIAFSGHDALSKLSSAANNSTDCALNIEEPTQLLFPACSTYLLTTSDEGAVQSLIFWTSALRPQSCPFLYC